jgi:DNA-binding MurR/RpiR family transcriptional regulator
MGFRERVLERFEALPPRQQLVAEFFLDHQSEVPFLDIPDAARRCGVSEATVVRFAQRVGYAGFAELKHDLMEDLRQRVVRPPERPAVPEALSRTSEEDMLAAVTRLEVGNVQASAERLDRDAFRAAAAAIYKADHVYTYGLGISSYLAGMLSYLLTQIGLRSTWLSTSYSSPLEQLVALRPSDLLVVLSFPPYSRQTVDMLRKTVARGLPSIAICDRATSPVGIIARHVLPVKSDNLMFSNSFAAISTLLNALTAEAALLNREQSVEAVSKISQVLDDDEGVIKE